MRLYDFVAARVAEDLAHASTDREMAEAHAKAEILSAYSVAEFCEMDAWAEALAITAAVYRSHGDYQDGWTT